jgi:hypothetical protein
MVAQDTLPPYSTTNTLGNIISGEAYFIIVRGLHLYSKLMRVNRDSRNAALNFYRVHLPCYFQHPRNNLYDYTLDSNGAVKGTLYFNPEYDFVHLLGTGPRPVLLAHFLHDFRAHDPRHLGILNVAWESNTLAALSSVAKASASEPRVRATVVDFVSRVQQIIWMAQSSLHRSIVEQPFDPHRGIGVRFIHSMPLLPANSAFRLFGRDPRSVGPELKYVVTGNPPQPAILKWRELLENLQVHPSRPPKERILFARQMSQVDQNIDSLAAADEFLKWEDESWTRGQSEGVTYRVIKRFLKREPPVESAEDLARAVKPAIGFWLFPVEAIGDPKNFERGRYWRHIFDMSEYWPELAVAKLS